MAESGAESGTETASESTRATVDRRVYLDRLRGLAVLVMIEVHVTNALLAPVFRGGATFRALDFVNGLVAPSFLFCAGVAAGIKPHPLAKDARRSLVLLALGYLLHLSGALRHDWAGVFQADVLQIIALASFAVALVLRAPRSRWILATAAIALVALTPTMHALDTSTWPAPIRPYVNDSVTTQFPLFPWAAYVFAGAACARLAPKHLAIIGVASLAIGLAVDAPLRFGLVATFTAALSLLDARPLGKLDALLSLFGRRSLLVYFTHIAIVYGTHPLSLRSLIGATQSPLMCAATWLIVTATMIPVAVKAPRIRI